MTFADFFLVSPDFRSLTDLLLLAVPLLTIAILADRLAPRQHFALALLLTAGLANRWLLVGALFAALAFWRRAPGLPLCAAPAPAKLHLTIWSALLLLLCAVPINAFLNDGGDAWWWLNEGRVIAEHGLNQTEWFTATIPDAYVPPNDWLSALLAYRLHEWRGWPALRGLGLFCGLFPVFIVLLRFPLSARLALAAFGGCWLLRDELALRAVLTVVPLLMLAQWWCAAAPVHQGSAATSTRWWSAATSTRWWSAATSTRWWSAAARRPLPAAFGFAALTALWANLHLSFFLALIFPAARLLAAFLCAPPAMPADGTPARCRLWQRGDGVAGAMLVGGALGACLHPLGWRVYAALAHMLATQGTVILDIFQPPALATPAFFPSLLYCGLILLAWRGAPPAERFATAMLLVAFLGARRNLLFLVPAALPLFSAAPAAGAKSAAPAGKPSAISGGLRAALAFIASVVFFMSPPALPLGHPAQDAAYAWLAQHAPAGAPVLNHYVLGGRLGWQAYPRRLVFIDGRNHLFEGTPVWHDYLTVHFLRADFPSVLARYPFRFALWPEQHPVALMLRARGWSDVLVADGVAVLQAP